MKFARRSILLAVLLILTAFGAAGAQHPLATQVQERYSTITSMRAEYTQTLLHKESGSREQRNGVLSFSKPLLVRMETTRPSPEILLVAKDVIWNVFPEEEIAYKYAIALARDSGGIIQVITGQASLDKDFVVEDKGMDGQFAVLDLFPRQANQSMVEVRLWIDQQSRLIRKLRVFDFYGNENEIAFTKQEINAPVAPSLFTYSPPRAFVVEDRSQDAAAAPKI